MTESLQQLVEALAVELSRPVGIDDRRFHALAYSPHGEDVDEVRRTSILGRQAPQDVSEWLRSLGIESASGQVRVAENRELGMDARLCVPLRFEEALLGYLWLIDEPKLTEAATLAVVDAYAEQMAAELARARRLEDAAREHRTELLQRLLFDPDPSVPAAVLSTEMSPAGGGSFVAIVARPNLPGRADEEVHLALAAERAQRSVPPNHAFSLLHQGDVVLVLAYDHRSEPRRCALTLLEAYSQHLEGDAGGPAPISIGIGEPRHDLARLRESYREARLAADVARRVPGLATDGPVSWESLGAYRTVAALLGERQPDEFIPPSLARLLEEGDGTGLVETLEVYLETGCDAQAASARLFLHRSSLYKRLQRIERVTGCDLRRGSDRLELHLGLRLWRLGGAGR